MAEPLTKDTTINSSDLPSYGKEVVDSRELTKEQSKKVKDLLKKAVEDGVVCGRDEINYHAYLARDCTADQREDAINNLPEHLQKKAEYLKEYISEVETHFSLNGELTEYGQNKIDDYKEMTGDERKEESKKLRIIIKEKTREKKAYKEILEESPHFSENGQMTAKAQELFESYESAGTLREKFILKRKLLDDVRLHEGAEKECEKIYKIASLLYERGMFAEGETSIGTILALCDDFPDSPRMQVLRGWNERDLKNMTDHREKQMEINILIAQRDHYLGKNKRKRAIEKSKELTEKTEKFFMTTINRHGEKIARIDDYKTNYLENLYHEARSKHAALTAVHEEKEEQEEEIEEGVLDQALTEDIHTKKGNEFFVKQASLEEELSKEKEAQRTAKEKLYDVDPNANEDIQGKTDAELKSDDGKEVVVDFYNNNVERAETIARTDANTGVSVDGRVITEEHELQKMADESTQEYIRAFTEREKANGNVSDATLDKFRQSMEDKTETGQWGRQFKKDVREAGPEEIELGRRRHASQTAFAEKIAATGLKGLDKDNVPSLAEEVRRKRQEMRQAA